MRCRNPVDPAVQAALGQVYRGEWAEKLAGLDALAKNPSPAADVTLLRLLDHRHGQIRSLALSALAERSTSVARIAARAVLSDPDWSVRNEAAELLGKVGTRRDVRRLSDALRDENW